MNDPKDNARPFARSERHSSRGRLGYVIPFPEVIRKAFYKEEIKSYPHGLVIVEMFLKRDKVIELLGDDWKEKLDALAPAINPKRGVYRYSSGDQSQSEVYISFAFSRNAQEDLSQFVEHIDNLKKWQRDNDPSIIRRLFRPHSWTLG